MQKVLEIMEHIYAPARPVKANTFPSFSTFSNMVTTQVEFSSSPGEAYPYLGNTNANVFGWNEIHINTEKTRMVYDLCWQRYQDLLLHPVADLIKLFIKDEPHKVSKIDNGAFRLIISVTIVDILLTTIFFSEFWVCLYKKNALRFVHPNEKLNPS